MRLLYLAAALACLLPGMAWGQTGVCGTTGIHFDPYGNPCTPIYGTGGSGTVIANPPALTYTGAYALPANTSEPATQFSTTYGTQPAANWNYVLAVNNGANPGFLSPGGGTASCSNGYPLAANGGSAYVTVKAGVVPSFCSPLGTTLYISAFGSS